MRDEIKLKYDGDPNTFLDGDLDDLCSDKSSSTIYKKTTGRGVKTGWVAMMDADDSRSPLNTSAQTTSYTLVLADAGKVVEISNGSANTLTVPPAASVAFPVGTQITFIQTGAGLCTITAGAAVTINKVAATLKSLGQYSRIELIKRATNTWNCNGDLAAS